jgi:hypothetical protein
LPPTTTLVCLGSPQQVQGRERRECVVKEQEQEG